MNNEQYYNLKIKSLKRDLDLLKQALKNTQSELKVKNGQLREIRTKIKCRANGLESKPLQVPNVILPKS